MQRPGIGNELRFRDGWSLDFIEYYLILFGMKQSAEYARISITMPQELLAEADRLATEWGRSRSWVIAEAMRRLGASGSNPLGAPARPLVRDPSLPEGGVVESRLGEQRFLQFLADLKLSPAERVRAGEEAARPDTTLGSSHGDQLLAFTRYEDYLAWDHRSRSRP